MKLKHLGLFFLIACTSLFFACSDDDEPTPETTDYAQEISGNYKTDIIVTVAGQEFKSTKKVILSKAGENQVKMELKDFQLGNIANAGDITLDKVAVTEKDGVIYLEIKDATPTVTGVGIQNLIKEGTSSLEGTIKDKKTLDLQLNLDVDVVGTVNVDIKGDKLASDVSNEAKITELEFDSEFIIGQPMVGEETTITLFVKDEATEEDLAAVPFTIAVSEKAKVVEPIEIEGVRTLDLSKGSATIIVEAEDMTQIEYTIQVSRTKNFFDFEEWIVETKTTEGIEILAPVGWATSNIGAAMATKGKSAVAKSDENNTYAGKISAKIETYKSEDEIMEMMPGQIPFITAGSLFMGKFNLFAALSSPLKATEFGVPFSKKPLSLSGYYKYKPGDVFYVVKKDAGINEVEVKEDQVDECSINAILYDITDQKDYITGLNTYDDERIVAEVRFSSGETEGDSYKEFKKDFIYREGKSYDPTKEYRLAIIASSSAEGASFSGAPGSTLYLDDVEIISEVVEAPTAE